MSDAQWQKWDALGRELIVSVDDTLLANFRAPGGKNNRLTAWDAADGSTRYFKFMLFGAALRQTERFFTLYRKLGNTSLGNPIRVTVRGCPVNIDYLFSLEEFLFLECHVPLATVRHVVEIGPGFGRTCHTLLRLLPSVQRYTLVDFPNMLVFIRKVLEKLVPDLIAKVDFISADDSGAWSRLSPDLTVVINTFQEMPPPAIDAYMDGLVRKGRYFYSKNAVAKYAPESVGLPPLVKTNDRNVFALGYCTDVIDVFDDSELEAARRKYLAAYLPGPDWRLLGDAPADLLPLFHSAAYAAFTDGAT